MRRKTKKRQENRFNTWAVLFFAFAGFSLIILPVVQYRQAMDLTLMPRMMAWTVFLFFMVLIFSAKELFHQIDFSVLRKAVFAFLAAYLLISLASLIDAVNATSGFFDLFRTFNFMVFLAMGCIVLLKTPEWQIRLAKIFVVGALLTLTIGYFGYFSEFGWGIHPRSKMKDLTGLMSNVNLYASYLMLLLPMVAFGVFSLQKIWKRLAVVALILNLVLITLLQTRAVYLGVFIGAFLTVVVVILAYRQFEFSISARNRILLLAAGSFILVATGFAILPDDNPIKKRIKNIYSESDNPRLLMWEASLDMIRDNPVTGVGAGNFHIRAPEYAPEKGFRDEREVWIRPHNDFIWVASEKGIPGLLTYIAIFGAIIYYIFSVIFRDYSKQDKILILFVFMGLAGYMVNAVFDFPLERVNHQVVLAIYFAITLAIYHSKKTDPGIPPGKLSRGVMIPVIILLFTGMVFSFYSVMFEKHIRIAREAQSINDSNRLLSASNDAQTFWRNIDPVGNPVYMYQGLAYVDMNNVKTGVEMLERARQISPNSRSVLLPLGYIYLTNGQNEKTIAFMDRILSVFPEDEMALTILARAYYQQAVYEKALETIEKIPPRKRRDDLRQLQDTILAKLKEKS